MMNADEMKNIGVGAKRILIVEDEPAVSDLCRKVLTSEGFEVDIAVNEVNLTPTEYKLLQELVLNAGKVLTYTHFLNKVWGSEYRNEKEYLHVYTGRLRAKLEPDPTNPKYILTVPGVGYQFKN